MGAIVDTLFLGEDEISLFKKTFPDCVLINLTDSSHLHQRYRLIIPSQDLDDSYYYFLIDNHIAMSSISFRSRLESDEKFTARMEARAATMLGKLNARTRVK